jgi:hypothetical protein
MRSPQAVRVILTVCLAVISQYHISAAQVPVTQTGRETIESYDSAKERLTISVEYSYQWQAPRIRTFTVPPKKNLIGEVSFSPQGTGACTWLNTRVIGCASGITSFHISYRYWKQIFVTEDGLEEFTYQSDFERLPGYTNAKYDLFYPFYWTYSSVDPVPNPIINVNDLGHLTWVLRNKNVFLAKVRFQITENVVHEVDGCSIPTGNTPFFSKDDPAASPVAQATTAFGKEQGKVTAKKILPLPCNQHDLCYQTCGASKTACDNAFFNAMFDVCLEAFPLLCPYVNLCEQYADDRDTCFDWAEKYKDGVAIWGQDAYDERQEQYCTVVDIQN